MRKIDFLSHLYNYESSNEELLALLDMDMVRLCCSNTDKPTRYGKHRDPCSAEGIREIIDKGCEEIMGENTHFTKCYKPHNMIWHGEGCVSDGLTSHEYARDNVHGAYPYSLYPDADDSDYRGLEAVAPCFFSEKVKCYACICNTYAPVLWYINENVFKHTCGFDSFWERLDNKTSKFIDCGCNGRWDLINGE